MKTFLLPGIRPAMLAAALLISLSASAQSQNIPDVHNPDAYAEGGLIKATGAAGRLLSTVHYVTRNDALLPYDSSWMSYDATGQRLTELLNFRWNGVGWVPYDRYSYNFNSSGLNHQTLYDVWNLSKAAFLPVVRYNYTHDAAGNRTQLLYELWNQVTTGYKNGLAEYYTLDAAGLRTTVMQQT